MINNKTNINSAEKLIRKRFLHSHPSLVTNHLTIHDLRFTINGILILILFMMPSFANAEEGEIQINLGGGGFFPLSLKTDDATVVVYASWNVALSSYFGITDNFDIGIQPSFTRLKDASRKTEYVGMEGREYFNYWRFQTLALVRYNLYPGGFFSPHIIAGGGFKVETFTDWDFYTTNKMKVSEYSKGDYAKVSGVVAGGIDLQFRVWKWFMLSTQVLYKWSPDDHSVDLFGFLGATFFINYYR